MDNIYIMIHPFKIVYLNEDTINKSKIEKVILFTSPKIDKSLQI